MLTITPLSETVMDIAVSWMSSTWHREGKSAAALVPRPLKAPEVLSCESSVGDPLTILSNQIVLFQAVCVLVEVFLVGHAQGGDVGVRVPRGLFQTPLHLRGRHWANREGYQVLTT